jgi:glycerol-3-phosphate cytidylyltransferase
VVGVPSDEVVLKDKGNLPIIPLSDRLTMLQALSCVDTAIPYLELEFLTHLDWINPKMLIVGESWGKLRRHRDAEEWVVKHEAKFVKLPYYWPVCTTSIKKKIINRQPNG